MKDMNRLGGHIACFAAYAIFGINIITCKDLTSGNLISPITIFTLRSLGAGIIFWILSLFLPKEKVERKDYLKIFAAAFLGYFVTQLTFLVAIPEVTPMHCSIISSMSPIYTMFIAAFVLKEPLTWKKAAGVLISLCGILFLIFSNARGGSGASESSMKGIMLMFLNSLSFSLYLGIFKPVIAKYSVVTFMKWIFLFSALMAMPMSFREVISLSWTRIPSVQLWELGYLIVFATFISYFLIPVGQKRIRPTLVSMYSYIQPIIATVISIIIGMDILTWQKLLAAGLVFFGVFVVSRSPSAAK
ncbi:MAG: EamA family transporter [Bacteroidales bacterium]|nr:EamA family transporter [Bacteroidales bacterium]